MADIDEIFMEEQDDTGENILHKYNKKIILKNLTWLERLKILLVYGIKIKEYKGE